MLCFCSHRLHCYRRRQWEGNAIGLLRLFVSLFVSSLSFEPTDLDCYMCMDHDRSLPGIESQEHWSRLYVDGNMFVARLSAVPYYQYGLMAVVVVWFLM